MSSRTPIRRESQTILDALGERANEWLDGERIVQEARSITYAADMRYHRQGYEIPVPLSPDEVRESGLGDLEERFNALHEQLYGFRMNETEAEIVNLRAIGFGSVPKLELPTGTLGPEDGSGAVVDEQRRPLRRRGDADQDLRPLEARSRHELRRPGDRGRVRLDHRRPARLQRPNRRQLQHPHRPEGLRWRQRHIRSRRSPRSRPTSRSIRSPWTSSRVRCKSARYEMDAVLFRSAMSPVIREQHDEFPMITDPRGRMVVGQFGAYINEMMEVWDRGIYPGDVILTSDPFKCSASISHTNDWLVLVPIFYEDELVGWSSQFGHQMDCGGPMPGSLPTGARTIFEEGIIIPPLKIIERGVPQEDVLKLIFNNVRLPEMNRADLFAIVAGCRAGEKRVVDLCDRFGKKVYLAALQALLDRTYEAMRFLIQVAIPEEPQTFVDYVDDDGLGNGPFKMQLTIWREGDHAFFDWSGTDPQALGPVNFYLSEGMFKMFIGIYLIMVNDPQILFNDGFYPLLHVVMPQGSLLNPRFPSALGCRTHALARLFDVLGGALCKNAPELNTRVRLRDEPVHALFGLGRERRVLLLDGDPLRRHPRPADRRRDGRALVVAALREHPDRVPGGLLPDADRRVHDRLGQRSAAGAKRLGQHRGLASQFVAVHAGRTLVVEQTCRATHAPRRLSVGRCCASARLTPTAAKPCRRLFGGRIFGRSASRPAPAKIPQRAPTPAADCHVTR